MKIMLLHAAEPIARELSRRGHEVVSCNTLNRPSNAAMPEPDAGGPIYSSVGNGRKINWTAIRNVSALIRRFRPDVVHAFIPSSLTWGNLATTGMQNPPPVVSFRGITRSLRRLDPSEWISYLSPRVAMHACESKAVMDAMVDSGVRADKCRVVYNVHWDFDPRKASDEWRSDWKIDNETWVIGTVAHVRKVKGIDILLRAALRMTDLPDWRLVIVGNIDDDEVAQLAKCPELNGRVVLQGYRPDAPAAMKAYDVFVMPSRSEGLCRSLIEAMTLGVCPIVSSAGGMKELVRHEHDGLVFPVEDIESLHLALRRLYHDRRLRDRLAMSAMDRVRTMCTPEVVAEKLESIYRFVARCA